MKKLLSTLIAALMLLTGSYAFAFSDTAGHWAESEIDAMTELGYLNGYPDGSFRPDDSITRAEFLKILTTMYDLTQNENGYMLWRDVEPQDWYGPYSAAGLLLPVYSDGNLYPDQPLERFEAAYATLLVYGIEPDYDSSSASSMPDYSQYSSDADLCAIISSALDNGIMQGKGDGFAPYEHMTRAELCTLLNRLDTDAADVTELNSAIDRLIDSDALAIIENEGDASGTNGDIVGETTDETTGETTGETADDTIAAFKREVFELVNAERAANGLSALTYSDELDQVAQAHSEDMAANSYLSHTNLDGLSPFDRMAAAGISYYTAAENIAAGQRTPEAVMESWMNSEGHRANILNPDLKQIGIGVAYGGDYGIYWTQCFTG